MAMKSSSVCALEPEKITKTKWIQYYGTPCIYVQLYIHVMNRSVTRLPVHYNRCCKRSEDLIMISILLFAKSTLYWLRIYQIQECSNGFPAQAAVQCPPSPIIATSPVHTREQAGRYIVNSVQQCTVMFIDGVPSTPSTVTLRTTHTHRATSRHLCWVSVQVLVQG